MKIHKIKIGDEDIFISERVGIFKVIKPIKNEDGTINWFNLLTGGSKVNLALVAITVFIILGLLNEYSMNISMLQNSLDKCLAGGSPYLIR